jgi:hypothetical protein
MRWPLGRFGPEHQVIPLPDRHLKKHPEFAWQKARLHDMNAHPCATFSAAM